jgi:flagellar hook assembly protein FlgD
VGTHGNGIYSYSYTNQKSDSDTTSLIIPKSLSVSAYPNPFSSERMTILYEVPQSGNVEIKIYDISGKYISEIINQYLSPNTYTFYWDGTTNTGSPVPKGIYFVRIISGGSESTAKIVWMK